MAVAMGRNLSGVSMLPARGTERPASAKSREKTSSFALVLKEKGRREWETRKREERGREGWRKRGGDGRL